MSQLMNWLTRLRRSRHKHHGMSAAKPELAHTASEPISTGANGRLNVIDGGEVALEVLQAIGYRKVLKSATIVSFNMQDYDFWGHGSLSHLLLRQLSLGASIRLMTTPPPGKPTAQGFKTKYRLLTELVRNGVSVFLNDKLHAKAYLFVDSTDSATAIIGSANLTGPGFGIVLAPHDNLVEMAVVVDDVAAVDSAHTFVDAKIVADRRTEDFATWFARNSAAIGEAEL